MVGAVIDMGQNEVLLLKRAGSDFMGGLVELPSGTVDAAETIEEALKREVFEETGLTVCAIDFFIGSFDYLSASGKKTRQLNFKVSVQDKTVRLSFEHEAFYICPVSSVEYQALNISAQTREIIKKAFQ